MALPDDRRRPQMGTASKIADQGDTSTVGQTADHFVKRLLQDCLAEATRAYWDRRAETFAAVGTPACDEIARACRARASLSAFDDLRHVVAEVLREVA